MSDVTAILARISSGEPHAADQLLPLVYEELRRLAAAKMKNEKPDHTLQATALVHEAYARLIGDGDADKEWNNRGHFFQLPPRPCEESWSRRPEPKKLNAEVGARFG